MSIFNHIFTWWSGYTVGTGLFTWRHGVGVGKDDQGNRYFRQKNGDRRWVLYNGEIEASRIPPEWHAWLHHMTDAPPTERPLPTKLWEKEHLPNLTGTAGAYFPPGSLNEGGTRRRATGDYEAWQPE